MTYSIFSRASSSMAPNAEAAVQTQLPIPVPSRLLRKGNTIISRRHVGCRRIFVQTDTGSVLGLDLDRADSAQTVKKKMQSLLNVPTEQTSLVFGDMILKNDLSEIRNDVPILLTRGLQRSLSTPCFCPPTETLIQMEQSQPLEIVGGLRCSKIKCLIREMVKAIECGVEPVSVSGGLGGAYYFRNTSGESIAIVKPTDEEPFAPNNPKGLVGKVLGQPGLKRAVRIGETGIREVAAYLLDHEHFARVPPTVLIKAKHRVFHMNNATPVPVGHSKVSPVAKIASCQEFVAHDCDANELGASRFSVSSVHRIAILDIRIFNTDRHGGNILVRTLAENDKHRDHSTIQLNGQQLIPIDHGLCLPETFEDPYFEWLHWPQATLPFSDEELDYIRRLDVVRDVEILREELPMLREACLRMLTLSTTFLKIAATAGLCLAEIGAIMSRGSCGMEEASELELLCFQAKLEVDHNFSAATSPDRDSVSEFDIPEEMSGEQFQFYMDQEDDFTVIGIRNSPQSKETRQKFPYTNAYLVPVKNGFSSDLSTVTFDEASPVNEMSLTLTDGIPKSKWFNNKQLPSSPRGLRAACGWFNNKQLPSSPRGLRAACGKLGTEGETHALKEKDDALGINSTAEKIFGSISRAQSLRSISFSYRRQRCPEHMLFRKRSNRQGISVSEVRGQAYTTGSCKSVLLGEMTEDEWIFFMGVFEELLQEALANWHTKRSSHGQRLGASCQF